MRPGGGPQGAWGLTLAVAPTLVMAMGLAGCQGWPFRPTPVPARLTDPTPACLAGLSGQARAWTGKPVVLTDAAFADDARLVLAQPLIPGPDGLPLNGRITDPPAVLTLVKVGAVCRTIHPDGGEEADLPGCTCQPLTPTSTPVPPRRGAASSPPLVVSSPATLPPLPPGVGPTPVAP